MLRFEHAAARAPQIATCPARIEDRLGAWKQAAKSGHVGTMVIGARQPEALRLLAETML